MELGICTKMLKNLSEKLRAKLLATARGNSKVKIARLDDAFGEFFQLESKFSRRSITAAKRYEKETKESPKKKQL